MTGRKRELVDRINCRPTLEPLTPKRAVSAARRCLKVAVFSTMAYPVGVIVVADSDIYFKNFAQLAEAKRSEKVRAVYRFFLRLSSSFGGCQFFAIINDRSALN